jgi:hypothetical protein
MAKNKENMIEEVENTEAVKIDPMEELVEYAAPLLPDLKKQEVICAVNGEIIRVQRGETVKIKRKFVKALERAAKQEVAAMRGRIAMQQQANKPLAGM